MSLWMAELQYAVYQRLKDQLVGASVHNAVPQTAKGPYIILGSEITELPGAFETQDGDGSEETFYIHLWDEAKGSLRLKRIMAEVDRLLHDAVLDLGNVARAHLRREFASTLNEQVDDSAYFWRHGVIRYRALIHGVAAAGRESVGAERRQ